MRTRLAGMTSPSLSDFSEGSVGSLIAMYFWPNRVVGRISMLMFSGMFFGGRGDQRDLDDRLRAVVGDPANVADERAVSAYVTELGELQPGVLGLDRHHRRVGEGLLVDRDRQPDEQRDDRDECDTRPEEASVLALGVVGDVDEHRGYPVIRTVVVEPQMAKLRKKSATTIVTIEVRIALPTAVPTPAGPPEAV